MARRLHLIVAGEGLLYLISPHQGRALDLHKPEVLRRKSKSLAADAVSLIKAAPVEGVLALGQKSIEQPLPARLGQALTLSFTVELLGIFIFFQGQRGVGQPQPGMGQAFIEREGFVIALYGLAPPLSHLFSPAVLQPIIGICTLLLQGHPQAHLCHLVAAQPA
ncbi:MAG: hypothetical protein BWY13_00177 [Euryarchaeota archaeon ADurb.Bin190]|nr:MAG: hypothetical protein BWY13_00177 [Euryarchaeota archaeon ADurb.Bin190]